MYLNPLFRTPFTDQSNFLSVAEQGGPCGLFQLNFFKCMEAYGQARGRFHCDLELRDFMECTGARKKGWNSNLDDSKQRKRFLAIRQQRMKLFLEGKLDRPYERNLPRDLNMPDMQRWNT